jgi:aryl-alcohol dehydrogenase-like predicted oxidoreductase
LFGARKPGQLDRIEEAFGWNLDADAMMKIDRIIDEALA